MPAAAVPAESIRKKVAKKRKKVLDIDREIGYYKQVEQEWRNWQTRTVQVRVNIAFMRVQVPFPASTDWNSQLRIPVFFFLRKKGNPDFLQKSYIIWDFTRRPDRPLEHQSNGADPIRNALFICFRRKTREAET